MPIESILRRLARFPILAVVALALPALAAAQAAPDMELKREVLAEGIYLFRAPSDLDRWTSSNVVVIVNDQDVTVFDSNTRPMTARMVIAEIRKLTSKPVRTLINSHWHMDHWSGNDEYAKAFPGVQIIATAETRGYMTRMGSRFFSDGLYKNLDNVRASLDTAVRTGKARDGSPFTPEKRSAREAEIKEMAEFADEVAAVPRVLPTLAFHDSLTMWSGAREFRLMSATGDASGSTVLYLPGDRVLVMGDVLVAPEHGSGPPPWTTNSYAISPWLHSLERLSLLDATVVVPGQGPAFHDKTYLTLTRDLFASVVTQVHAAMRSGIVKLDDLQARVNADSIGLRYTPGKNALDPRFRQLVASLVRKVQLEAFDGVAK